MRDGQTLWRQRWNSMLGLAELLDQPKTLPLDYVCKRERNFNLFKSLSVRQDRGGTGEMKCKYLHINTA
jgi:hypothetical protein